MDPSGFEPEASSNLAEGYALLPSNPGMPRRRSSGLIYGPIMSEDMSELWARQVYL